MGGATSIESPTAQPIKPKAMSLIDYMDSVKSETIKNAEPMDRRLERYLSYFQMDRETMVSMQSSFVDELTAGLREFRDHEFHVAGVDTCFKMLDSYCGTLPTGNEQKVIYALDFGGTNFRVVRADLKGQGVMDCQSKKMSLRTATNKYPKGLMDAKAPASEMFDFFANCVKSMMDEAGDPSEPGSTPTPFPVGLTFSFPAKQFHLDSAELIEWTKEFETGRATKDPVENADVCELLNFALVRCGVNAKLKAVMNDTVGTLLSTAYEIRSMKDEEVPSCLVGVILGTGSNVCYVEPKAREYGYVGDIINVESGAFNHKSLPRTNVDEELDFATDSRGRQVFEKMHSGAYCGDLCRRLFLKILTHEAPEAVWKPYSFSTENAAQMVEDETPDLSVCARVVRETFGAELSLEFLTIMRKVCVAVMDRSAACGAVMICAASRKTGRLQAAKGGLTVAVDGALYVSSPWYRERVLCHIKTIVGDVMARLIRLVVASDASGKGAAILAAMS